MAAHALTLGQRRIVDERIVAEGVDALSAASQLHPDTIGRLLVGRPAYPATLDALMRGCEALRRGESAPVVPNALEPHRAA